MKLSEEFLSFIRKVTWLHPNWQSSSGPQPVLSTKDAGYTENQVAAFGGGNGVGELQNLVRGLAVPDETAMPYRRAGYGVGAHGRWMDTYWSRQRNVDDFNLLGVVDGVDLGEVDLSVVQAPGTLFARGGSVRPVPVPARTDGDVASTFGALQDWLRRGYEVVWDFYVYGDRSGPVWQYDGPLPSPKPGSHAMLLIGFDTDGRSRDDWYLVAKNSWGPTTNPDGLTHISVDYLRYGIDAGVLEWARPLEPWPELWNLGRWKHNFAGWRGDLDIYHLPGISQPIFDAYGVMARDRRLGTYFDRGGSPFRVNGFPVADDALMFWIDPARPNLRWDETSGRQFSYFRVQSAGVPIMCGWHTDPDGSRWSGYATKGDWLASCVTTARVAARTGVAPRELDDHLRRLRRRLRARPGGRCGAAS